VYIKSNFNFESNSKATQAENFSVSLPPEHVARCELFRHLDACLPSVAASN